MTVNELISLNNMIVDISIDVRDNGLFIDALRMGPHAGIKPPYPTRVPRKPEYARQTGRDNENFFKDAPYIRKSINAWDDGHDYWELKVNRLPKGWGNLEVWSWDMTEAYITGVPRRMAPNGPGKNVNFHGKQINIIAMPVGQCSTLEVPKEKSEKDEQMDGQLSIFDLEDDNA